MSKQASKRKLDRFTRAYIECALWAETDQSDSQGGAPLEDNYGIDDIAPDTLVRIVADCRRFQEENRADIGAYPASMECADRRTYPGEELAGHDFWLTRNRHGAGFWDRDCLTKSVSARLTRAADAFSEVCLFVGDDGMIHQL